MRPEIRAAKDVAAMSELTEWCAPLSLTIDDNGCEIIIRANGFPVKKACYRRPWRDEPDRTRRAAYRELIRYIAGGGWLRVSATRELKNPDGSAYYDNRVYEFRIPECASPGELAIKLAAKGWRMPETVWQDAV